MELLNHTVLVIKPKEGLKSWLRKICLPNNVFPVVVDKASVDSLQIDNPVFLMPQIKDAENFIAYFDKYGTEIFNLALAGWCEDESLWPEDRSYENFIHMFGVELHGIVLSDIPSVRNE